MARFVPIRNGSILACAHHAQLVWRQPTFRPHVGAAPVSLYVCQICAHAQRPHFGLRSFRTALRFPFLYCFFHLRALILVPARGYPLALQLFPQGSWLSTCTHGQKCVHEQRLHFSCRPFDTIWYFPFIPCFPHRSTHFFPVPAREYPRSEPPHFRTVLASFERICPTTAV